MGLLAGEGADGGEGDEDDYGQVYDDADAGEDPQVEEEAMQDQAGAPEDYADDEDLYNDIVPGIGQVDGVGLLAHPLLTDAACAATVPGPPATSVMYGAQQRSSRQEQSLGAHVDASSPESRAACAGWSYSGHPAGVGRE